MHFICRFAPAAVAVCLVGAGAVGQSPGDNPAEEMLRRERVRGAVEEAMELALSATPSGALKIENLTKAALSMRDLGADAVPFLAAELDLINPRTFFFAAYSLGHIGAPQAEQALRAALERADGDPGDFASARKAWSAYGLGLMGVAEAIRLVNVGNHTAGHFAIHANTSTIEAIALQTIPDCVPILIAELDRLNEVPDEYDPMDPRLDRKYVVRALRRVGDRAAVPKLLEALREPYAPMRYEAALALGELDTPESRTALIAALDDEDFLVRDGAARALGRIQPNDRVAEIAARLEKESDPHVRGAIYRIVAVAGGKQNLDTLRANWGRPDAVDRGYLIEAVGLIQAKGKLDLLRAGLADPDNKVAVAALNVLAAESDPAARDLLVGSVRSPRWPVAQQAARLAGERGIAEAATVIARRLFRQEVVGQVSDARQRSRAEWFAAVLIELEHVESAAELRKAAARQTDMRFAAKLNGWADQLDRIAEYGTKKKKWLALAAADEAPMRFLAYRRLATIGGDDAARSLVLAFEKADQKEERVEILERAGELDAAATRALLRRVLVDAEFDSIAVIELREAAAWSARRLGGDDMLEALRQAVQRRDGREARVMIYLAQLAGKDALPLLAELRSTRMRYIKWTRGHEQDKLDWIAHQLSHGRSIAALDVAPERIHFR